MSASVASRQAARACGALQRERVPCPLCGGEDLLLVAGCDRYGMDLRTDACQGCGFLFTNPRPTAEGLTELYRSWYRPLYGHESLPTPQGVSRRGLDQRARHTLSVLERFGLERAAAVLEVGCGPGALLRAIGAAHPAVRRVGVEGDPAYVEFVREHAACEALDALPSSEASSFDFVVLVHSLEHFAAPVELLRQLRGLLGPGGILYVDVPDARRYSGLRDLHIAHLGHFTLETLLAAASKAGFSPLLLEAHDPPCNVPSIHGVFRPGDAFDASRIVARIEEVARREQAPQKPAPPGPQELFGWFAQQEWSRPWMVLGKGPSFARRGEVDLSSYHLLGLNHVCREQRVELAHAIDLEVVQELGPALLDRVGALVMPWRPHVQFKPGALTLAQLAVQDPALRRLSEEGRLLWYNCSTAPEARPGSPVVQVCWFSGEAGVRLLGLAGVQRIRSLGIDGGRDYAPEFGDLTPLQNGHRSFDHQNLAIGHTVDALELDYAPLFGTQGPEQAPPELEGLLGDPRTLLLRVEPGLEDRLPGPADLRPALVLLGELADHPRPAALVRALRASLTSDGALYVCGSRSLQGSAWSSARARARASRWWLSEGFRTEVEHLVGDGRKLVLLHPRRQEGGPPDSSDVHPRVTIVLVTHGACEQVVDLLGAIRALTRSPHVLRVVDNASTDDLRHFLRQVAGEPATHVDESPKNLGCAAGSNLALEACDTEYVIYLCAPHALVLQEGWDTALVRFMDEHPELSLAGDAWVPPYLPESDRYAAGWDPTFVAREELLHVQGGAWIARRALFDRVGLFAADRYPQGGMDVELSFRLLSHGEKLGAHPAVSCPSWPRSPDTGPEIAVIHPAGDAERRRLRERVWRGEVANVNPAG